MTTVPSTRERYRGALLGLAAGDALGTTLEFKPPGSFRPIDDMVGGGPFHLQPGQWTDDTSMALCLAESLTECGGFDAADQMRRYVRWWHEGYMASNGHCFDIGDTVRSALSRFQRTGDPYAGSTDSQAAGNGSLMRLAPVPLYYAVDAREAIARSAESSRTTHATREAVDACRYYGGLLVGAVRGADKATLLSPGYCPVDGMGRGTFGDGHRGDCPRLLHAPRTAADSGFGVRGEVAGGCAVGLPQVRRLPRGALLAANLGNDADTTAAIYGQLAGAHYGVEGIPAEWRAKLAMAEEITALADALYEQSGLVA